MKIELPIKQHRNFVPFEGVAIFVDTLSDRYSHVTNYETKEIAIGPKIILTRAAAEEALPTLLGMGVCVEEGRFQNHATRSKCGLITEAWIAKNELWIRGGIYGLDYPDVVSEIEENGQLGLCPAMRDMVVDPNTLPDVASILRVTFCGVAIMSNRNTGFANTYVRLVDEGQVPEEDAQQYIATRLRVENQ